MLGSESGLQGQRAGIANCHHVGAPAHARRGPQDCRVCLEGLREQKQSGEDPGACGHSLRPAPWAELECGVAQK